MGVALRSEMGPTQPYSISHTTKPDSCLGLLPLPCVCGAAWGAGVQTRVGLLCLGGRTMCCGTMKRYLFPAKKEDFYISRPYGNWAITVDVTPEGSGLAWEMVPISYCPFCGTLLTAQENTKLV